MGAIIGKIVTTRYLQKYNKNNNERLLCPKYLRHRTGTLQLVRIIKEKSERVREDKCFNTSVEKVTDLRV